MIKTSADVRATDTLVSVTTVTTATSNSTSKRPVDLYIARLPLPYEPVIDPITTLLSGATVQRDAANVPHTGTAAMTTVRSAPSSTISKASSVNAVVTVT